MKKTTMTLLFFALIAQGAVYAAPRKSATKATATKAGSTKARKASKPTDKKLVKAIAGADAKAFEQELDRSSKVAKTEQGVKALIGQAYLALLNNKEDSKASRSEKGTTTRRLNKIISLLREKRASVLKNA